MESSNVLRSFYKCWIKIFLQQETKISKEIKKALLYASTEFKGGNAHKK